MKTYLEMERLLKKKNEEKHLELQNTCSVGVVMVVEDMCAQNDGIRTSASMCSVYQGSM